MSTNGIYIEVDQADIKRVQNKLKDASKASSKIKNAINRTVTQAMRQIRAGRSQGYTIKAGRFNQDIKTQRANAAHLDATIKASGRTPTLKGNFKTSTPKAGAKADITKSGLKSLRTSGGGAAFIGPGGSIEGLIAQRTTSARYPLRVLYGNSVPKMVEKIWEGERGGQGDMTEEIRAKLMEEMRKEIAKLI
ncbi:MAG: hypothetical protein LUC83_02970 [Clostridiales bacterium]|nr:hypothetical protein [Clostridiales bacterium]